MSTPTGSDGHTSLFTHGVAAMRWALVVVDEAHLLHKVTSATSPSLQSLLLSHSDVSFRVLLTGTPLVDAMDRAYTVYRSGGSARTTQDQLSAADGSPWQEVEMASAAVRTRIAQLETCAHEIEWLDERLCRRITELLAPVSNSLALTTAEKSRATGDYHACFGTANAEVETLLRRGNTSYR